MAVPFLPFCQFSRFLGHLCRHWLSGTWSSVFAHRPWQPGEGVPDPNLARASDRASPHPVTRVSQLRQRWTVEDTSSAWSLSSGTLAQVHRLPCLSFPVSQGNEQNDSQPGTHQISVPSAILRGRCYRYTRFTGKETEVASEITLNDPHLLALSPVWSPLLVWEALVTHFS